MKREIREIVIITGLFVSLLLAGREIVRLKKDVSTKSETISGLLTAKRVYKTRSGQLALEYKALELSRDEIRHSNDRLLDNLHDLKIRLRHAREATQLVSQTKLDVSIPLKDSVIIVYDSLTMLPLIDSVKSYTYRDKFISLHGEIYLRENRNHVEYCSTDSIISVLTIGKRDKWWRLWERRPLVQTVTNKNPNSEIKYARHVKINRR